MAAVATCTVVSYNTFEGDEKEIKPLYYANIRKNALASLIKCLDRCNNLACMADGFTKAKMRIYVIETEKYIVPLLDVIKEVPEEQPEAYYDRPFTNQKALEKRLLNMILLDCFNMRPDSVEPARTPWRCYMRSSDQKQS